MPDNYAKLWSQKSVNDVAIARAADLIQRLGRALPCRVVSVTGAIVTVAFEINDPAVTLPQITIPKAESNWIRMPTQPGDFGMTMPANAYLGYVAGFRDSTTNLDPPGNLCGLVFVPVSSQKKPPPNQTQAIVQGPGGALIQTTTGTTSNADVTTSGITLTFGNTTLAMDSSSMTLTASNNTAKIDNSDITLAFGSTTISMDSSSITLTASGKTLKIDSSGITLDGILWDTHVHGGVVPGGQLTHGPQ